MVIVDANNVLFAAGSGRASDGVPRLLEAILHGRYASRDIVLVCDGSPGGMTPGSQAMLVRLLAGRSGARVTYAGPEREADDVIESMIANAREPDRLLVVSSDARLVLAAYRAGAASITAAEFVGHLEKDRSKAASRAAVAPDALDRASVAWWMDYFGLEVTAKPQPRPERTRRPESPPESLPAEPTRSSRRPNQPRAAAAEPLSSQDDWLAAINRMWPGLSLDQLDMESVLQQHPPGKKRRKKK